MFCRNCGNKLKEDQHFCNMCGTPVRMAPPSSPTPVPVVEEQPTPAPEPVVVDEPTPAPAPVVVDDPTPVPAPVVVDEPTPAPAHVVVDEPTPAPVPVVVDEPTPAPAPVVTEQPAPAPVPIEKPRKGSARKIVLYIVLGILAVGLVVGAFIFGRKLSGDDNKKTTSISEEVSVPEVVVSESVSVEDVSVETVVEPEVEAPTTTTVMVYMIGSNLESARGYASADIFEMLNADIDENVNVVLQTGGCTKWSNPKIKGNTVQRFHIENESLVELENLGKVSMVSNDTLSDFISFAANEYPADRYYLILWDHGGGDPVVGFGMDELFTNDMITYDELPSILQKANVHLDAVITDACDMCTLEVAAAIKDYADYLVASEQSMPGTGTYYTGWLGKTNNLTPEETCITIAKEYKKALDAMGTIGCISVIDCSKIDDVMSAYGKFLVSIYDTDINTYFTNRDKCGSDELDIIDIISLASWYKSSESITLQKKTEDAVVFYDGDTKSTFGLAAYSPYRTYADYSIARKALETIDYDEDAIEFYDRYASLMYVAYQGQIPSSSWYDDYYVAQFWDIDDTSTASAGTSDGSGETTETTEDGSYILTTTKYNADYYEIELPSDLKQNLSYLYDSLYVYINDVYYNFGVDVMMGYEGYSEDYLYWERPSSWIGIDGTPIPFFTVSYTENSDGTFQQLAKVNALVNNQLAYLIIYADDDAPAGTLYGYYLQDDDSSTIYPIEATDMIQIYIEDLDGNKKTWMDEMPASSFKTEYVRDMDFGSTAMILSIDSVIGKTYVTDPMFFD